MNYKTLINEYKDDIVTLRRTIHQNPELSFQEFKTTQRVIDKLKNCNVEIRRHTLETGVIVILEGKKEGDSIGFRADLDALKIQEKTGLKFLLKKRYNSFLWA